MIRVCTGLAAALVMAATGLTACSPSEPESAAGGSGYWTRHRLLDAQAGRAAHFQMPSSSAIPSPTQSAATLRVGALFGSDRRGDHFCTASVVDSRAGNVLITAAHCINSGTGNRNRAHIEFIPNYVDGQSPNGVWTPKRYVMDRRWINGADQDLDVAFIVLKPLDGKNIEDVLGGNGISFNAGYTHFVRVTGYPSSAGAPIACQNWTTEQEQRQLKFSCANFTGGTSGSPWIAAFNPVTRNGTIVGVIGGYQQGGNTMAVSYSSYLNNDIKKLYDEANSE